MNEASTLMFASILLEIKQKKRRFNYSTPSVENKSIVDIFTKPLNSVLFHKMKTLPGMVDDKKFSLRGGVGICKLN